VKVEMSLESSLQAMLRQVSEGLLTPVMIVLLLFAAYAVWCIGSIIVEVIMERRHFKENVPEFIDKIEAAQPSEVQGLIENSGLLKTHKSALMIVASRMTTLSSTDLYALAKREIDILTERYGKITARTDMAAKLSPMFGLMGTLIPLGPGIVAMGGGRTDVLADSLLVAFDTTVAGLVVAAVCLVVSKIRKTWYARYISATDAAMTAVLQKASQVNGAEEEVYMLKAALEAVLDARSTKTGSAKQRQAFTSAGPTSIKEASCD
jgi:biopolymer transport protein ExbB/TolQ